MKDWVLVMIVLLVVSVDLVIHTVGTAIPEARLNATLVPDELTPNGVDVRIPLKKVENKTWKVIHCTKPVWVCLVYVILLDKTGLNYCNSGNFRGY